MKSILSLFVACLLVLVATAQSDKQVQWSYVVKKVTANTYEIQMKADISGNYHLYSQNIGVEGPVPTRFQFSKNPLVVPDGKTTEVGNLIVKQEDVWGGKVRYYEKSVTFVQKVKVRGTAKTSLAGKVEFMVCDDKKCLPPSEVDFKVNIGD